MPLADAADGLRDGSHTIQVEASSTGGTAST